MKIKQKKRTALSLRGALVGLAPQTKLHDPQIET